MKVLFVGDIVGQPGVAFLKKALPLVLAREGLDLVVANAENAAGGSGLTPGVLNQIREAGVEVERHIEPDLPPVMADAASLESSLRNLISNAVKYGGQGHWVGIRAANGGAEVQISVEDKGPGIEPADLPHIFEPFYRGPDAVNAQIHGTGLGLSLVKRFIEAQGGRVTVKSTPGEGSSFTLHLPIAPESGDGGAA